MSTIEGTEPQWTAVESPASEWRNFWTLPLAAAFGYSGSTMHTYALGAFMEPVTQEFGWSRAQMSGGLLITGLVAAALSVPIGITVDRVGPRRIALIGILLMCSAIALLGTATGTTANWIFLWCVVAFANLWQQTTVWTSAVASRFERSRGLAFALTLTGSSIAAMVFPLLATSLIRAYGWRSAFMAFGAIWALVVFPMLFLFFRGARDHGQKKAVAVAPAVLEGMTPREGFRTAALYQLLVASGLFTFTAIGIIVHFVPILRDAGAEPMAAASVAGLIGMFSIIGRVSTGFLLDRFSGSMVGAFVFLLPIIACGLLYVNGQNPLSQSVAAGIFGLTVGAEVDVIAFLIAQHFGLKHYGVFSGGMVGALALGAAFGPLVAGGVFDHYHSYKPFLIVTAVFMAASSLALATLQKPAFATRH